MSNLNAVTVLFSAQRQTFHSVKIILCIDVLSDLMDKQKKVP